MGGSTQEIMGRYHDDGLHLAGAIKIHDQTQRI